MGLINQLLDLIMHIDVYLNNWVSTYQTGTYLILFLIIFCETGLVVTPFLPGDSLLFATGAIAAMDGQPLNILFLIPVILVAAFSGDNTNYFIGKLLGQKVYKKNYKLIKREYLEKTNKFYEKHGGKTLIIARFMPIIRTFAPFVAGVGKMKYLRFVSFSVIGNFLWVFIFILAGYYFGNIPYIKNNFTIVILSIILISLLPPIIAAIKHKISEGRH